MTTDRRLHDMDLGRRDHTRWLGSSGRYSTQGIDYGHTHADVWGPQGVVWRREDGT